MLNVLMALKRLKSDLKCSSLYSVPAADVIAAVAS